MFELSLIFLAVVCLFADKSGEALFFRDTTENDVQKIPFEGIIYRVVSEHSQNGDLRKKLLKWAVDKTVEEAKKVVENR